MQVPRTTMLLAMATCVLAMTWAAAQVEAHARLVRADPAPGSTVRASPRVVRAVFNEELDVKRSAISVTDTRGLRVDDGRGGVDLDDLDRKTLIARLSSAVAGTYTVRWTAVSVDDLNAARGTFRFTIAK